LAQARGRLAVDDRRGDRVKVASQCPCISVGTPHLDHGVGGMTFNKRVEYRTVEEIKATLRSKGIDPDVIERAMMPKFLLEQKQDEDDKAKPN
jgi:hypothetical protein